jgi:hypothetical protein
VDLPKINFLSVLWMIFVPRGVVLCMRLERWAPTVVFVGPCLGRQGYCV